MDASSSSKHRGAAVVRWVVYSHLVAVAVFLGFPLADRRLLGNSIVSQLLHDHCNILTLPFLLAWFVCPAVLVIALACGQVTGRFAVRGVLAEIALCIGHYWVLLPLVS